MRASGGFRRILRTSCGALALLLGVVPPVLADPRTIMLQVRDIAFDTPAIAVRTGETVRFVVRNSGLLPHSFVIGPDRVQRDVRLQMRALAQGGASELLQAVDTEIPALPGVIVPPGETRSFTWTFGEAGLLRFSCPLPGHHQAGMVGEIRFER